MDKALLILFGGRSMPNMLSIIHEKPSVIVPIISSDAQDALPQFIMAVEKLLANKGIRPKIDTSCIVDAFDWQDVKEKSLKVVATDSQLDWTFNITSATTIMSIGAFEAAKELSLRGKPIRCWYLNTSRSRVIPLLGDERDANIFYINVEDYVTSCYCTFGNGKSKDDNRSIYQSDWLLFAQTLGKKYQQVDLLKDILKEAGGSPKSNDKKT